MWLAQFTKFFVDYLLETDQVMLHNFRAKFSDWLQRKYGGDSELQNWLKQCGYLTDYRTTIAAHFGYLWKECHSIGATTGLCKHPIWGEVNPYALNAIPRQPNLEHKTVVTPFVFECFKHMYFHEHMEIREVLDDAVSSSSADIHMVHISSGRFYAAKVINKRLMAGREHMVRNEIAVLKRVSMGHQNILTLVDFFETMNNRKSAVHF